MLAVWLRSLVNRPSRYPLPRLRRGLRRPGAGRFRPQLEALESRTVLNGGILDPTFGTKGVIQYPLLYHAADGTGDGFNSAALEPNGDVVVAGVSSSATTAFTVGIFSPQGTLLNVFTAPHFSAGSVDVPYAVAIEPLDGQIKIVVVGTTEASGASNTQFAIARFNANGTLDSTFGNTQNSGIGTAGEVAISFSTPSVTTNDVATCVAIDPVGHL
jgi:Domain of unknown function (DUF5122) beta-propeller